MEFPLNGQEVHALCHTFIQSLWQGIILAAAAGLIIICTRKRAAALRYNLLVSALLLFATGVFITFVRELRNGQHATASIVHTAEQSGIEIGTVRPATGAGFVTSFSGYLNSHSNTIVLIWFIIISIKIIQLMVGLYGTYQLRHNQVFSVSGHWKGVVQRLSEKLRIKQHITMLESGLAKVPVVIGSLKPVILIPIGLLNSLSQEATEVILMHELAHIRRMDFLVNLVQNLLEIIFFFNPAVLWVSLLIKEERENCCDDLALRQGADKANYIRALLSCEQYRSGVPALAMAFPGDQHSLLSRVQRLANNRNHSLNPVEKTLLAFCLILSGLCLTAVTKKEPLKETEKQVVKLIKPPPLKNALVINPQQVGNHRSPVTTTAKRIPVDPISDDTIPSIKDPLYEYEESRPNGAYAHAAEIYRQHRQTQAERDSLLHEVLTDMLKDGIVSSAADDLVFSLSRKGFIVNGDQQDNGVMERYMQKYAPAKDNEGWTWTQSYHH